MVYHSIMMMKQTTTPAAPRTETFFTAKQKAPVAKELYALMKPTYFTDIPLEEIEDLLRAYGLVLLQEDGTPLSCLLCGESGEAVFEYGHAWSVTPHSGTLEDFLTYTPFENTALRLTWYKMASKRYECLAYLT